MKKIVLFLAFVLGFGAAAFSYENTYAVIVGVSQYKDPDNNLNYASKDAMLFRNFLMSEEGGSVPAENICFLINSDATKENIVKNAKALFAKANKKDRVIFYFSGHGGRSFFAPHDYEFGRNKLSYADLKEIFQNAKSMTKLIFADACFSGGLKGNRGASEDDGEEEKQLKMNIAVMLSCKSEETSLEITGGNIDQGLFTYYLIKGLGGEANRDGNGFITIQELFYYVYANVAEVSDMMEHEQHPQLFGKFDLRLIVGKDLK